jgi:hypothetical protein
MKKILLFIVLVLVLVSCDQNNNPTSGQRTVATPSIAPGEGVYSSSQNLVISCSTSGAEIRYTLDGTEPTEESQLYDAPFQLTFTATVKARAFKDKWLPSAIASASYQFQVANLFVIPMGGSYVTPQTVQISSVTPEAVIYYTTDGTEPTVNSSVYSAPIIIDRNTNLKARGLLTGWTDGPTVSVNFSFQVEPPIFSLTPGTYNNPVSVALSTPTTGAEIRFTTDGTDPTASSDIYSAPLSIVANTQIKARAYKDGWNASSIISGTYNLKVAAPVLSPPPTSFNTDDIVNVTITCATTESTIHYTLDGSNPTTASTVYSTPISVTMNTTVKAMAERAGWVNSNVTTGTYNFTIYAPVFNPAGGQYTGYQEISMTSQTPDADIRYTINHTTPTQTSTLYTEPIVINTSTSFRAIAFKQGFTNSPETTSTYFFSYFVATPYFLPAPGEYTEPVSVTILCETVGADIRYTTDESDPNPSSPQYTEPILIDTDTIFKAKAYYSNWAPSNIETAEYTFTP